MVKGNNSTTSGKKKPTQPAKPKPAPANKIQKQLDIMHNKLEQYQFNRNVEKLSHRSGQGKVKINKQEKKNNKTKQNKTNQKKKKKKNKK